MQRVLSRHSGAARHMLAPVAGAVVLGILVAACGSTSGPTAPTPPAATAAPAVSTSPATTAAPSPASGFGCTAPAAPTTAQSEGPYFTPGSPEDADLTTDAMPGTRLTLSGTVVDTSCAPLAGAKVDVWQADSAGVYDNAGYTLRGHVLTDADGRYNIRTVVPGEYPGRTEHIHVKITPAGGTTLTSQLYFPGTSTNDTDGIFSPDLVLAITESGGELAGTFTFVVEP